jgi:hypothetical protein
MRGIRLIARSDEFAHEPGLMLAGIPNLDGAMAERGDGVLIAHDILEHCNGVRNIGNVWDELEALGAIWEVRGRHGDLRTGRNIHSPAENIAFDITRMFPDWQQETRQRFVPTRCCVYDEDFREMIEIARRDIRREHEPSERGGLDAYLDETLHRLRIGFRKARRRFGGGYAGYEQFAVVQQAAADAVEMIDFEGQEFVLAYDRRQATVRPVYEKAW